MGSSNLNLTLISFLFILFTTISAQLPPLPFLDVCSVVPCGEGECVLDSNATLGFACQCYPGWKAWPIEALHFSPCLLPNCTMNSLNCSNNPPPPQPPPQPNNCALVLCNYGTCVSNGIGPSDYECKCDEGTVNVANIKTLPCFPGCTFKGDCHDLVFGAPSPPPPSAGPPPTGSAGGTNHESNCAWNLHVLPLLLLAAIILTY